VFLLFHFQRTSMHSKQPTILSLLLSFIVTVLSVPLDAALWLPAADAHNVHDITAGSSTV
jgi:hypothetical protein